MPDTDRMMERMLEGLALLTQQVSRLAFAAEAVVLMQVEKPDTRTCRTCQSRIQDKSSERCLACWGELRDG